MGVLNSIDLEGASTESWDEAARVALAEAARTIRGIRRLDVVGVTAVVRDNDELEYRSSVRLYFEVEAGRGS